MRRSSHPSTRPARLWAVVWLTCCLCLGAAPGCSSTQYVRLRSVPRNPLALDLQLGGRHGPQASERTRQVLRQYDLSAQYEKDPASVLPDLEAVVAAEPNAERLYALAELSFIAGKRCESSDADRALDLYGASTAIAFRYLFDEQFGQLRNPYDPQFRGACDLYNGALESALRIVKQQGGLRLGNAEEVALGRSQCVITIESRGTCCNQQQFSDFEFVSDYETQGLTNVYHTYGLGVPLIGVRQRREDSPLERYYPEGLSYPVTAFLRMLPAETGAGGQARHRGVLELYDPLDSCQIALAQRQIPLESDLSTPLAYFLNNPQLTELATQGLLDVEASSKTAGVYMVEPYQSGKIPVVMVHGLWSSPITWMEMFNDLRSDPQLRERYQFWFYLYPTGQPFWDSATQFRRDLAQVRATFDPHGQEAAFDQMVLVGHSMGGLVSKMQVVASGDAFWRIVSDRPFSELQADSPTREHLEELFFFSPNPSVRRIVTIGTPHRGSPFANQTTKFVARKLISMPRALVDGRRQLHQDNRELFRDASMLEVKTSIDSLAPDSPVLAALLAAPHLPGVKFHNIVGVLPEDGLTTRVSGRGDGVVTFESAHLEDAVSELVVPADHISVHRHPLAVLEVRRILLEHLQELDGRPAAYAGERWPAQPGLTRYGQELLAQGKLLPVELLRRTALPFVPE